VGWVVLVIAVVLALLIAGWLWWRNSRASAMSIPTGRRATDEEIASTIEPDAVPIIPPPSGAGVPMAPIVPNLGPDRASEDERGGPLPDVPAGESGPDDDERPAD
jgi:hypothetical protein